jgi:hypothetical protein
MALVADGGINLSNRKPGAKGRQPEGIRGGYQGGEASKGGGEGLFLTKIR